MTAFVIKGVRNGAIKSFIYDNEKSTLTDADGVPVKMAAAPTAAFRDAPTEPTGKVSNIKKLKIQLGLSCNYSCEYCSQRFVPHAGETNKNDIEPFLTKLPQWFDGGENGQGKGVQIQYWGGEPLVYWKTFKPLAEALHERYPDATMSIITNGSLLDDEKNAWLDQLGFSVSVSHDGPGQHVRGPDPLEDPKQRAAILDLFKRLHPKKRFSFNAMMNRENMSRAAVRRFFIELTGVGDVQIGEGSFIDPYDEGGLGESLMSAEDMNRYVWMAFEELMLGKVTPENNQIAGMKVGGFIRSIAQGRHANALNQKCTMDDPQNIAVDLRGNVLTCQNVSANSLAPNGLSHKIGTVDDLAAAKPVTSRHWSKRDNCRQCPVLQLCHGSCMFLEGELWQAACNNSFADNIPFFAFAFEIMTGYRPVEIIGGMVERQRIWELQPVKGRRIIPIKAE
jgi:uncharacterized protein